MLLSIISCVAKFSLGFTKLGLLLVGVSNENLKRAFRNQLGLIKPKPFGRVALTKFKFTGVVKIKGKLRQKTNLQD